MAARLDKSRPFTTVHGEDELGRVYGQVQNGVHLYFDGLGAEVIENTSQPETRHRAKPGPKPKAESGLVNQPDAKPVVGALGEAKDAQGEDVRTEDPEEVQDGEVFDLQEQLSMQLAG